MLSLQLDGVEITYRFSDDSYDHVKDYLEDSEDHGLVGTRMRFETSQIEVISLRSENQVCDVIFGDVCLSWGYIPYSKLYVSRHHIVWSHRG